MALEESLSKLLRETIRLMALSIGTVLLETKLTAMFVELNYIWRII